MSITDPAVANADYNNSGLANAEKYHFNLHPFAPVDPEVPAPPVKVAAKAAPLAKVATKAPVPTQGTKPADIGNFKVADVGWKDFSSKKDYKGGGFEWKYINNGALDEWKVFAGTQMEVWKAGGE